MTGAAPAKVGTIYRLLNSSDAKHLRATPAAYTTTEWFASDSAVEASFARAWGAASTLRDTTSLQLRYGNMGGWLSRENTQFAVAIHVLAYLAGVQPGRVVSSDDLAFSTGANPVYVRRVLGPLRDAGFVTSRPGKHGGWEFATDAAHVTLGDVWQLVQGDDPVFGLHGANLDCPVGRSVQGFMAKLDREIADALVVRLRLITVADVLADDAAATKVLATSSPGRWGVPSATARR